MFFFSYKLNVSFDNISPPGINRVVYKSYVSRRRRRPGSRRVRTMAIDRGDFVGLVYCFTAYHLLTTDDEREKRRRKKKKVKHSETSALIRNVRIYCYSGKNNRRLPRARSFPVGRAVNYYRHRTNNVRAPVRRLRCIQRDRQMPVGVPLESIYLTCSSLRRAVCTRGHFKETRTKTSRYRSFFNRRSYFI